LQVNNRKQALIIGAAGFVGGHLTNHLLEHTDWEITSTKMKNEVIHDHQTHVVNLDILNFQEVALLFERIRPDFIFHLAAQSSVALSWKNPGLTIDVNIKGSLNVLDAIRSVGINPKLLLIGSGEEYGFVHENELPINEENRVRPGNIYAVTKVTQNLMGKIYAEAYGLNILMVRAFNHIGPNQSPQFVVADFCKQVSEIEKGKIEPKLFVGNLTAFRDFTDVRDVVTAYTEIIQNGNVGETYNVGQGKSISIHSILQAILKLSTVHIDIIEDQNKFRPIDVPHIEADISKIKRDINWTPKIPLEQTLKETLDYWRIIVNS
jgi:GDP-4-dehydro-6-deoxy-D-mannose reductase